MPSPESERELARLQVLTALYELSVDACGEDPPREGTGINDGAWMERAKVDRAAFLEATRFWNHENCMIVWFGGGGLTSDGIHRVRQARHEAKPIVATARFVRRLSAGMWALLLSTGAVSALMGVLIGRLTAPTTTPQDDRSPPTATNPATTQPAATRPMID